MNGVKEKCIWNDVSGYDVLNNGSVDIMHDIAEGVGSFVMAQLLIQDITKDKFFSMNFLNDQIKSINGSIETSKKPGPIDLDYIIRTNSYHKMSASESSFLFYTFLS